MTRNKIQENKISLWKLLYCSWLCLICGLKKGSLPIMPISTCFLFWQTNVERFYLQSMFDQKQYGHCLYIKTMRGSSSLKPINPSKSYHQSLIQFLSSFTYIDEKGTTKVTSTTEISFLLHEESILNDDDDDDADKLVVKITKEMMSHFLDS